MLSEALQAVEDEAELVVVVIARAFGALMACAGDALAGGFIGQIERDLADALLEGGEEDSLLVLDETAEMAFASFDH